MTAWVAASTLSTLALEARQYPDLETGGLLLGYWKDDEIVVASATGPGPNAQRGRTWFRPDQQWQTEDLARAYAASGRTMTYLGDWHTHPGGTAIPSRTDRRTMRAIKREAAARQSRPLMGIVAPEPDSLPVLWCLHARRRPVVVPYRVYDA